MTARWLALPLLAWILIDFSNPLLPGAVSFDLADSIEAVRTSPPGAGAPTTPTVTLLPPAVTPVVERRGASPRPERSTAPPRRHAAMTARGRLSADPPPDLDDD